MENELQKNDREMSLYEIVKNINSLFIYLLSKWRFFIVVALIGGVTGGCYAWLKKPKYKASLTFSTDAPSGSSGGLASIASQFGLNIGSQGNSAFNGDNLTALIQSKKILQRSLLKKDTVNGTVTNLLNFYIDVTESRQDLDDFKIAFPLQQDPSTYNRLQDSVLGTICNDLLTDGIVAGRTDKKLDIFQIVCTTVNEEFSKRLSEELIRQVSSFYIETQTKQAKQTVDILQKRADSIKTAYDYALTGRATESDINLNPAFQGATLGIQKKTTDITVLSAAYAEIIKNLELAKFNLLQRTPLIQIIDDPVLPLQKIKPGRLLTALLMAFVFGCIAVVYQTFKHYMLRMRLKEQAGKQQL